MTYKKCRDSFFSIAHGGAQASHHSLHGHRVQTVNIYILKVSVIILTFLKVIFRDLLFGKIKFKKYLHIVLPLL